VRGGTFETRSEGTFIRIVKKNLIVYGKPLNQFLKSPFLLPILSMKDLPEGFLVTYPHIPGNLEQQLSPATSKVAERLTWRQYLITIYQVSEALEFLHSRNIAHGSVDPNNILIDEYGNARLGGCGLKRDTGLNRQEYVFVSLSTFEGTEGTKTDISMFGITIWQILKE